MIQWHTGKDMIHWVTLTCCYTHHIIQQILKYLFQGKRNIVWKVWGICCDNIGAREKKVWGKRGRAKIESWGTSEGESLGDFFGGELHYLTSTTKMPGTGGNYISNWWNIGEQYYLSWRSALITEVFSFPLHAGWTWAEPPLYLINIHNFFHQLP